MYSKTIAYLEKFDNSHDFERMSAPLLTALGYKDVVLIAPRGGGDGGMDITFTTESGEPGLAWVTLREDIKKKFYQDARKRTKGEFAKYILFTRANTTADEKKEFTKYCLDELDALFTPYDIEGIATLLDSPNMLPIREKFLYVGDEEKERRLRLIALLYQEYRASFDGIPPDLYAGTAPLPKEWAEEQLAKRGETWRQEQYRLY